MFVKGVRVVRANNGEVLECYTRLHTTAYERTHAACGMFARSWPRVWLRLRCGEIAAAVSPRLDFEGPLEYCTETPLEKFRQYSTEGFKESIQLVVYAPRERHEPLGQSMNKIPVWA